MHQGSDSPKVEMGPETTLPLQALRNRQLLVGKGKLEPSGNSVCVNALALLAFFSGREMLLLTLEESPYPART